MNSEGEIVQRTDDETSIVGHLPHRSKYHGHHHPNGQCLQPFENHDVVAAEEQLAPCKTVIDVDEERNEQSRANVSSQLSRHQDTPGNAQ